MASKGYEEHGGLKFVRWEYKAKGRGELSVQRGDEVKMLSGAKEKFKKVQADSGNGRLGMIPDKCFSPRKIVQWAHEAEYDDQISVSKGDVIGEIERNVKGSSMCKVFKERIGGEEGNIPQYCFYPRYEVHADHKRQNQDELSVKRGDEAGLVDKDNFDVYWKVFYKGKTGLVPSSCFEHPTQVHWDHEAERDDELTVKEGDTVTLVDHDVAGARTRVKVRSGAKVGFIPRKCFESRAEVYFDNDAPDNTGLFVKRGDIVGIVEGSERPPDGFLRVRLNNDVGLVPKTCFEIPAKVIRGYQKVKPNELTVKEGDEVRVMDATAYIQVRLGDSAKGEVPLTCIKIDVKEIMRMLENRKDDQDDEPEHDDENGLEDKGDALKVDEKALSHPLGLADKVLAVDYLKSLNIDEIGDIGIALGLSFSTLRSLNPDDYHNEMVKAWLSRIDNVASTGTPTWKLLGAELQKMRKAEIAERINKDNTLLEPAKLLHLEWFDDQHKKYELRIVNEASHKWRDIGILLGFSTSTLTSEEQKTNEVSIRFQHVLDKWIENGGADYPPTWRGLQQVLIDCEMAQLAERVKVALPFSKF